MKKITSLFLILVMGVLVSQAYAANPNPKPNCPLGQIALLEGDQWQCKQPAITSDTRPQQGLLVPAVQKVRAAANSSQAQPGGVKPACPKGQIAQLEMGIWQCKELSLTSKPQAASADYLLKLDGVKGGSSNTSAPAAGPRPNCPNGQLPKLENGHWLCKTPDLTAPAKPER